MPGKRAERDILLTDATMAVLRKWALKYPEEPMEIAVELVTAVCKSLTIDWTVRESARAKIRVMVRRILKKHGYPPDLREEAT